MRHAVSAAPLEPAHEAFALFRFAVIFVGIAERARQGNATDPEAERLAPLAARFASRGLETLFPASIRATRPFHPNNKGQEPSHVCYQRKLRS